MITRNLNILILICISGLFGCTKKKHAEASIDHIIVAINNLDSGINQIKRLTGIEPVYGGSHPESYTHNALFSVGENTYIEILAPRSDLDTIPRYFKQFDQLTPIGWAISSTKIKTTASNIQRAGFKTSMILPGSRVSTSGDTLRWKTFTIEGRDESSIPFFINWNASTIHPSQSSVHGCTLKQLTIQSQKKDEIKQLLNVLDFSDERLQVNQHYSDYLELVLNTPNGELILSDSRHSKNKSAQVSIQHSQHFTVSYHEQYVMVLYQRVGAYMINYFRGAINTCL